MAYSDLVPGKEITIHDTVYFSRDKADLSDLVTLSLDSLDQMKISSIDKEKAVYEKLCAGTSEWVECAAETLRIIKAMEYLKTPAVAHTSNVWRKDGYDRHEISNMVYSMAYRIYENTRYDHHLKKSVPTSWEVSWWVSFNTPHNPDYTSQSAQIAGQDRKRYADKETMEKYLQGRKDAFAHLFTELSPPIPSGQRGRFCINGQLLPGYTVEQERAAVVDELLEFLGDDADIIAEPSVEKAVEPPPHQPTTKHKVRKSPGRAAPSR